MSKKEVRCNDCNSLLNYWDGENDIIVRCPHPEDCDETEEF